jgi:hypothetical protein
MSQDERAQNAFISKLVLDMKGLALLHPSDAELRSVVRSGLLDTHDEQVKRVLQSFDTGRPEKKGGSVAIALGELILGSFLMAAGVVAIAPFLVGVTDPRSLIQYFGSAVGGMATAPAFLPLLPELVILLSVALLLSALYSLRKASVTLKEEGFVSR